MLWQQGLQKFNTQKPSERQEKEKKKKYCKPYVNRFRHFTPFLISTDGLYDFEAKPLLKRLAKLLAEKCNKLFSTIRGFINAWMRIALEQRLYASEVPGSLQNALNQFRLEGKEGLGLLKTVAYLEFYVKQDLKIRAEIHLLAESCWHRVTCECREKPINLKPKERYYLIAVVMGWFW